MSEIRVVIGGNEIRYLDEPDKRTPVDHAKEVPCFGSEADDQAFWNRHRLSERFWQTAKMPSQKVRDLLASVPTRPDSSRATAHLPAGGRGQAYRRARRGSRLRD